MRRLRISPRISVIFLIAIVIVRPALAQNPSLESGNCPTGFAKLWAKAKSVFEKTPPSAGYERPLQEEAQDIEREVELVRTAVQGSLSEKMFQGLKVNVAEKTATFPSIEAMNEIVGFTGSKTRARFVSYPGTGVTDADIYQRALARGDVIIAQNDLHDLVAHAVGMKYLARTPEWMEMRKALTECYVQIDAAKSAEATKAFEGFAEQISLLVESYTNRFSIADRAGDWHEIESAEASLKHGWEMHVGVFEGLKKQYLQPAVKSH